VVPDGLLWVHEIKFDGYRFICRRDGDRVRAFTRRGYDWTDRVPRIAEALGLLPVTSATIDGEAVVRDGRRLGFRPPPRLWNGSAAQVKGNRSQGDSGFGLEPIERRVPPS